jgi:Mg2+-importing ATPase
MGAVYGWMLTGKPLAQRLEEYKKRVQMLDYELKNPKIPPKSKEEIRDTLIQASLANNNDLLDQFNTSMNGLSSGEVKKRLFQYGLNEIATEKRPHWIVRLLRIIANPLVLLLLFIILISILTQDYQTTTVISIMVLISVVLRFYQETQAYNSAESLKSMIKTTCTVIREGKRKEIELKKVVPGDIIELSAGDIIPADVRILESKELYINQSLLTGEALPVEKHATSQIKDKNISLFELKNICFMGTNVESGHAIALVLQTGPSTYFGSIAKSISKKKAQTSFDKGIEKFTWLMITFMAVMAPTVFLINGLAKGNWFEAFMFAISIAVGLTPEMLPAIVTVNLSQGSINMAKKKVITKQLDSIQNLGAMNVVCTDKTGTLTLNKIVFIDNVNVLGQPDDQILHFAFINSYFQTGYKNLLDTAILKHAKNNYFNNIVKDFRKIDELPFDFKRKRLSIIVEKEKHQKILICKGAVDEVLNICNYYQLDKKEHPLDVKIKEKIQQMNEKFSKEGFRVMAVAYRPINNKYKQNIAQYENNLVFSGLMTFLDPPKVTAKETIKELEKLGVEVKILTGDNELITNKIATDVGIKVKGILLGKEIEKMDNQTLQKQAEQTTIFAKLSPEDKRRIVEALKKSNHVVGFIGDGINDAPALRAADVGISVDGAVDIAKESADIILLESSLKVLADGVVEGRKIFGNITKYIKMGASSNFGNVFSVLGASIFLPFLPMTPSQILLNNLLYDVSQTAIPLDNVDREFIEKPRKWKVKDIGRFMLFIGPISSIFDYTTYFMMLFVFHAWNNPSLFQTGWFVESLATQTLIIHVIRSKNVPFFQTWASWPLVLATITIVATGIFITFSPFAGLFGFVRLPALYWPLLILTLLSYITLTQLVKTVYIKKFGYN